MDITNDDIDTTDMKTENYWKPLFYSQQRYAFHLNFKYIKK